MPFDKFERQKLIEDILRNFTINQQEDLLRMLQEKGCEVTQATLSRDFREMKIAKIPDTSGNYIYRLPGLNLPHAKEKNDGIMVPFHRSGVLNINFLDNNIIVKTPPGYAQGIATDILFNNLPGIVTVIPYQDTVIIYIKENSEKLTILNSIKILFSQKI